MADATELSALADIKTLLGISSSNKDAILTIIKDAVEAFVKTYCGRDFLVTSYTEYHDGDDSVSMRMNQRPITAITSVHVDASRTFDAATLVPTANIITDAKGQELGFIELFNYRYTRGQKNVQVIYSAGYSTIPTDLSLAVKLLAAKEFKVADKTLYAESTQQVGDMVITLTPDSLPKNVLEILNRYRRIPF